MNVVKIGKKRYAVGLWWQMGQGTQSLATQARTLAARMGKQYTKVVLRPQQFGLGSGSMGSVGVPSLAATLAATLTDKSASRLLLCPFTQASLWWVCAIKEGCIAAEGDWLGHSQQEAGAHAAQLHQILDLPDVEILENEEHLSHVLTATRRTVKKFALPSAYGRVQNISSPFRKIGILGSTLLGFLIFFMAYTADFFTSDAALRAQQEARRLEILAHPERYFPRPWLEFPPVKEWSARCVTAILQVPFSEAGWEVHEATCRDNRMEVGWNFTSTASFLHIPKGAELLTPTTARKILSFAPLPTAKDVTLLSRDQVARRLYEIARLLGLHLQLNWNPKAQKNVNAGRLAVSIIAPWHEGTFTIDAVPSMLMLDKDFYEAFQSISGLVLQNLAYTNGTWKMKGICHGT